MGDFMKIQTGEKKGHKLSYSSMPSLRPTSSKVKEAIIDILRPKGILQEATVLDLYAGTGSVGLEFISNGASKVVFVERSSYAIKQIKDNIKKLNSEDKTRVIRESVKNALSLLINENKSFNIVFADPPFKTKEDEIYEITGIISKLLKNDSLFILEHSSKRAFSVRGLEMLSKKHYGDTTLSFYTKV